MNSTSCRCLTLRESGIEEYCSDIELPKESLDFMTALLKNNVFDSEHRGRRGIVNPVYGYAGAVMKPFKNGVNSPRVGKGQQPLDELVFVPYGS